MKHKKKHLLLCLLVAKSCSNTTKDVLFCGICFVEKEFICLHSHGVWAFHPWHLFRIGARCTTVITCNTIWKPATKRCRKKVIVSINTNLCFYCLYLIFFVSVDGCFFVARWKSFPLQCNTSKNMLPCSMHKKNQSRTDFP